MAENAPATVATINDVACRFDLTPVEEEFLLREFLPKGHWEHFYHTADIGVRGCGYSLEQAFEQAALALVAIVTDPASIRSDHTLTVECTEPDQELLFVDWINKVIYAMVTGNMLFSRFKVTITGSKLSATLAGEPMDRTRHDLAVEPKGATFTELKVVQRDDGSWLAQCVIDV